MKIRLLRTLAVDLQKANGEIWDKTLYRWQELPVAAIYPSGQQATIKNLEGDFFILPVDSFEQLDFKPEISKLFSI